MVERICTACRHGNPLENRFCGACGAALAADALAPSGPAALARRDLAPASAQIRQIGTAIALGAAALAAEAGVAWLRRRAGAPSTPAPTSLAVGGAPAAPGAGGDATTIVSQRIVEIWEHGSLVRQVVERHIWRRDG